MADQKRVLLVTGASGHLGRRVVELLLEAKAGHIVAATRTPEKLKDLAAKGAEIRHADFDDPASLDKAFAGAERLLLISTDALDKPGHRFAQHQKAVEAAGRTGVKHVLYTSMPNPEPGNPITFAPDHYNTEKILAASKLGWTILRHNWYSDYLVPRLSQAVAMGKLISPPGKSGAAYITREDCAKADAAALASSETGNKTVNITGPAIIPNDLLAKLAASITGKPVEPVILEPAQIKAGLAKAGVPEFLHDFLVSMDVAIAQGNLAVVSNSVKDLTGRAPESVETYLTGQKQALLAPPVH